MGDVLPRDRLANSLCLAARIARRDCAIAKLYGPLSEG
jgi:hypothetical protein